MTTRTLLTENAVTQAAGVTPGGRLAEMIEGRADIMTLTQATHDAILRPRVAGGISYAERAALACRIARLNEEQTLAEHFHQRLSQENNDDAIIHQMANPSFDGAKDQRLSALIRHTDLVTQSPKDASRDSITTLKNAGVAEADIVRLSEIIAFINYQVRVVAGLRLLGQLS